MEKRLTADLNVVSNSNLEIQLLDGDLNIIQKLDDEPNDVGGLTSAELKAKFDESGNIIKKYINETLIPSVLTDDATEESRKQAEAARVAAEQGRVTAEEGRVSAESGRVSAEQARANAEASRVSAETAREAAETARADETAGIVARATAQANAAAGSASQAAGSEQAAQSAANTASSAASSASQSAATASGSASQAQASAAAAAQSAASVDGVNKTAQSWAVGGTGTRPGEDTDNAKYWAQQAQAAVGGDFATKTEAQGYVDTHNQSVDAHADIRAAVAGSVRYDAAQELTDEQKAQARTNIGADTVQGAVRYDAAQSLTDGQKTQARGNIGAAPGGFGFGERLSSVSATSASELYADYCAKVDAVLAGMPDKTAKLLNAYPPHVYGKAGTTVSILYKGNDKYAVLSNLGSADKMLSGWRMIKANNAWDPFEWVNPPVELGVEYRTTERYYGEPVYVKVVDCGNIADNKKVAHGISNMNICFSFIGIKAGVPMPEIYNHSLSDVWTAYVVAVDRTNITLACGSSAAGTNCQVILKYIKTTD